MKKRVLTTALWFFAGWYVANILAFVFGVSDIMGPIVGTAAAALIGGDPFRAIWTTRPLIAATSVLAPESKAS
jgi:hypothetical protein